MPDFIECLGHCLYSSIPLCFQLAFVARQVDNLHSLSALQFFYTLTNKAPIQQCSCQPSLTTMKTEPYKSICCSISRLSSPDKHTNNNNNNHTTKQETLAKMSNTQQNQASDQDTKERQEAGAAAELLRAVEEAGSDEEEVKEEVKEEEEDQEEVKDRVYCYCNGPGTGRMVACDGKHCVREWFHFRCIGIKTAPTTKKWYCDDCLMLG